MEIYVLEAKEKIRSSFEKLNLALSEEQAEKFYDYYRLLVEWNEKINLTAITDFEQVLLKHFIDSCALCKALDMEKIQTVIDVGTGAGFPGVPLKIVFPHLKITLLDSLNKRIVFLDEIAKQLSLNNVETVHGRAEEAGHNKKYREQYDLCVSRAVANLSVLMEYCTPFVKTDGLFVSYKSGEVEEEAEQAHRAAEILHCQMESIEKLVLPDSNLSRSFVMLRKKQPLDKKYPRRAGVPAKNPL